MVRERERPKKSMRDRVIVREREREGPKKSASERVMESERHSVMARNSEKVWELARGAV